MKKMLYFLLLIILIIPIFATDAAYADGRLIEQDEEQAIEETEHEKPKEFIKWCKFSIPSSALQKALNLHTKAHSEGKQCDIYAMLAALGVKYGDNWNRYRAKDLEDAAKKVLNNTDEFVKLQENKYYKHYYEVYNTVLSGIIGGYKVENKDGEMVENYGLNGFFPIAEGFWTTHYDDFGDSRGYGYKRRHLGHDFMGSIGTPIVAVEGGIVEELGWNRYGGWRIGIRSHDKKRYYYYAHLKKDTPFAEGIEKGKEVFAGDCIGFLGNTGYSTKENVANIKPPHMHFGLQLIFDESQKEGNGEIWIDVYQLSKLLERHKSTLERHPETKQYGRKYKYEVI